METVSFLSGAFTLFLHLSKKKGASGSRDGCYPGSITTNESLQNKFAEEGATGSSSSEADAMLSRLSKSTGCCSEGFMKQQLIGNAPGLSLLLLLRAVTWRTLWPNSSRHFRISANCSLVTLESISGLDMVGTVENSRKPSCFE